MDYRARSTTLLILNMWLEIFKELFTQKKRIYSLSTYKLPSLCQSDGKYIPKYMWQNRKQTQMCYEQALPFILTL